MPNGECTVGAELRARVVGHDLTLRQNTEEHQELWEAVEKLRNRPPIWATTVISLLSFACGALLTYAKMQGA